MGLRNCGRQRSVQRGHNRANRPSLCGYGPHGANEFGLSVNLNYHTHDSPICRNLGMEIRVYDSLGRPSIRNLQHASLTFIATGSTNGLRSPLIFAGTSILYSIFKAAIAQSRGFFFIIDKQINYCLSFQSLTCPTG